MKAEHRHELEQNALNRGITQLAEKAKTGDFLSSRAFVALAVVVLLVVAGGYWLYASREHRRATAAMWIELDGLNGPAGLDDFAKETKDKQAGRIARLQLARVWLGPDGLQKLSSLSPEVRKKAIENVEKAREQFAKLAEEFKDDTTLRAQSIDGEAHAELALVGIPKEGTFDQYRGTPERAADLFKQYAKLVGESTKPGEEAKKKADDLAANPQEVLRIAQALNNRLTPPPTSNIELPKSPFDVKPGVAPPPPKAPDSVPPPIAPPTAPAPAPTTKATDPKAPKVPAAPPANTPKSPETKSPAAPTPTPPPAKSTPAPNPAPKTPAAPSPAPPPVTKKK